MSDPAILKLTEMASLPVEYFRIAVNVPFDNKTRHYRIRYDKYTINFLDDCKTLASEPSFAIQYSYHITYCILGMVQKYYVAIFS